jgi:spectinomycin phosphotransferase
MENQYFSSQSIRDNLDAHYGILASLIEKLPIGADMNASVYKVNTQSRQSYFVKIKRVYQHDLSLIILDLLHSSGIKQIIAPIKTLIGVQSIRIHDYTLTVYPFIKGLSGFDLNLTDDQWIELGKVLRKVHELDVPPQIKVLIKKETYSDKHRKFVKSLDARINCDLEGDEIANQFQSFMKEHKEIIDRLVNRAEDLSFKIKELAPQMVLCHSDMHAGNVLIDESGSFFIVDWDDPIIAPKERDLMFIGGGVGNVWNNPHEEELFYKGYGKTKINPIILAYYRYERIVEDIAEYAEALLLTTSGSENRQTMFKHFMDMFKQSGVVEIAFQSDIEY